MRNNCSKTYAKKKKSAALLSNREERAVKKRRNRSALVRSLFMPRFARVLNYKFHIPKQSKHKQSSPAMWSDPTKASSLNCDSDADEIVEEIPIYLSKHLQHLALYQFTSRKANDQLDRSHVVSSTVKPLNQEARLEFALDTRSSHYDAFKGDQFAIAADGQKAAGGNAAAASTGRTFPDGRMDRQAFVSTRPIENTDRFLVGMLHDKELHMTPLGGGILQMRPSFSYFDKSDVRNRAEKKAENDEDMEEAKQVTVQFARTENENVRKAREKSFGVVSQKGADEPWCETVYYARSTPEAALERNKLYSTILTDSEYYMGLITLSSSVFHHVSFNANVSFKQIII